MQHTLVAVFDNRSDAQNARNELLSSGFRRADVQLSNADPTGETDSVTGRGETDAEILAGGAGVAATIKDFLSDLFGSDNAKQVSQYEGAVTRGHHVLTLVADSLPEVERAADIVERYGPTDIDENASDVPDAAAAGASAGAMRAGSGMRQSSPLSAQSGSPGNAQAASIPALDNPGERELFQQRPASQERPVGGTYQEPLGTSGLGATGETTLHSSTLRDHPAQGAPLEASAQGGLAPGNAQLDNDRGAGQGAAAPGANPLASSSLGAANTGASVQGSALEGSARTDSLQRDALQRDPLQRDTQSGTFASGGRGEEKRRSGVRIFSRAAGVAAASDDDVYRGHYERHYAASGEKYEDLKPAYSYGSEMRRSELYRNRPWDDVEGSLRTGWDTRVDGTRDFSTTGSDESVPSTWERVKNAVRHGWESKKDDHDNDGDFRNHWNSVYGATGEDYDHYRPAYSYGSEMALNEKYRGRAWGEVEGDLRSDWDIRYPGEQSTWEKMKSAVRHGWDRMMR